MSKKKWSGLCEAGLHGLDFKGQRCDLCALIAERVQLKCGGCGGSAFSIYTRDGQHELSSDIDVVCMRCNGTTHLTPTPARIDLRRWSGKGGLCP